MKAGDLVMCRSAEDGKERLGLVLEVTRYGAYRVLLQNGDSGGFWTHSHLRKVQCR